MAVREFDGSDDDIVRNIGALSSMTYGTVTLLVKRASIGEHQGLLVLHADAAGTGARRLQVSFRDSNHWNWYPGDGFPSDSQGQTITNTSDWFLAVVRKGTGSVAPRFSIYNFTTETWSHQDGNNALGDSNAPGAGGTSRFSVYDYSSSSWTHADGTDAVDDAFDPGAGATIEFGSFHGRVAVQACWSDNLPFTADASGDSAIEAAGLETAYQNWIDNSPDAAWRFNQSSTTENVVDDTGNGADQTSITGTTVITGDDPPGFDFSLGGDIELDVPFFQNSAQIFNPTVQKQSPLEVNVPHFANINQVFLATVENQAALELDVPFLDSTVQIFVPQVVNEGDDLFEPILAGNGSYADQIFNGLVSQGFLTGSLADRERARLLSKLSLVEPQGLSLADLYRQANEENRLAGILVGI